VLIKCFRVSFLPRQKKNLRSSWLTTPRGLTPSPVEHLLLDARGRRAWDVVRVMQQVRLAELRIGWRRTEGRHIFNLKRPLQHLLSVPHLTKVRFSFPCRPLHNRVDSSGVEVKGRRGLFSTSPTTPQPLLNIQPHPFFISYSIIWIDLDGESIFSRSGFS